jgi:hypothetical protein
MDRAEVGQPSVLAEDGAAGLRVDDRLEDLVGCRAPAIRDRAGMAGHHTTTTSGFVER